MVFPENRYEFTIKEVSNACGISRATLIRMEECGFLTPYRIDSNTGYRFYDANNIAQIGQYQLLQELGLSKKEITDFYFQKVDIKEFLDTQKQKLDRLQRLLNELEMRYSHSKEYSFSFVELPEVTCYCQTIPLTTIGEMETFAFDMHQSMVKEGIQPNGKEPIFAYFKDTKLLKTDPFNEDLEVVICIPTLPCTSPNPHIKTFPACHAFSVIGHGNYSIITDLVQKLHKEIVDRNLKPNGIPRFISLVAPYVGSHISPENYCHELVVPVE